MNTETVLQSERVVPESATAYVRPERKARRKVRVRGVFERPKSSDIWWCRWTDGAGRLHREKCGTKSSAVAVYRKRKIAVLEGQLLPGKLRRLKMPTLAEFGQRFLDAISVECASKPQTVRFYAQQMSALLAFAPLADARLCDIDESLIEAFVQRRATTTSTATVNRGLATLRRALRREFVLRHEDEGAYLLACPQMLRDIALLLLDTGLRIGEALALEWPYVNLTSEPGYVQVRDGKSRYASRAVPLTGRVKAMLTSRRRKARSFFVFAEGDGKPMLNTSAAHEHAKVRRALGLPTEFVLHSLRHSFCTRLGEAGAEAFLIQRLAGHHSVTVSERYVHPTPEAAMLAIGRLEASNRALSGMPTGTATGTGALALPVSH
jgi:integrase